jgi:protein-L-isoaspartate(D-aspartate) O-methyltransferase
MAGNRYTPSRTSDTPSLTTGSRQARGHQGLSPLLMLVMMVIMLGSSSCQRDWQDLRQRMVREQIEARGVRDPLVVTAMLEVPRHRFLTEDLWDLAYQDRALPIGAGHQTPEPYVVALMSELLGVGPGSKVLEIGTGCGYHTAILAAMGTEVFSIEIQPQLCRQASEMLAQLGYQSAQVRCGNGLLGWPEHAPFDGIVVTGSQEQAPDALLEQLTDHGSMVIPLGKFYQEIRVITRNGDAIEERSVIPVRFRPLDER